jgi:hypothetical protein
MADIFAVHVFMAIHVGPVWQRQKEEKSENATRQVSRAEVACCCQLGELCPNLSYQHRLHLKRKQEGTR